MECRHEPPCECICAASCCLYSPLERCLYEEGLSVRKVMRAARNEQIAGLRREGVTVAALGPRFGLKPRSLYRIGRGR